MIDYSTFATQVCEQMDLVSGLAGRKLCESDMRLLYDLGLSPEVVATHTLTRPLSEQRSLLGRGWEGVR